MLRTLFGKLLLVFLGFGAVMTVAFLVVMQIVHVKYHRELDDAISPALAQHIRWTYAIGENAGFIAVAILFAVLASLFLIRHLTRRLGLLEQAMEDFRRDEFVRLPTLPPARFPEGDEIGRLTRLFGELAARVHGQLAELKRNDEALREFIANISHDLRTPLTTLRAQLDTMQLGDAKLDAAARQECLNGAMRQCERLRRLVAQLLEVQRFDARQVQPYIEPFQLAELVQDVVQKFAPLASERGVRLVTQLPEHLPLVVADVSLVERALDNLLENALRYTPQGGEAGVSLTAHDGRVYLEVRDTGPGMTDDVKARIFERFFRADPSRSSRTGHAGLGLSIVRSIVELHGGAVVVDSPPGHGSRLTFDLPVSPAAA